MTGKTFALAFALSVLGGAAQAHQIWIEPSSGQEARIRFGEFGENLRETSPGALDTLGVASATLVTGNGEKTAEASKTRDGFVLPFKVAPGESVVAEAARYPLYKFKRDGKELTGWYLPAARLVTDFTPQAPKLALDLVPAGKPGEFQLFYRGKPLPKTKVSLVTQSGWSKEKQTDEQGKVVFDMPWKGLYVAEASHKETKGGERPGAAGPERYDGIDYVTTAAYVKADGAEPIPAIAAPVARGK